MCLINSFQAAGIGQSSSITSTAWIVAESVFLIPQVRPALQRIQKPPPQWVWGLFPVGKMAREIFLVYISVLNHHSK
jgi:hypothetical protein